ncbi:MAG TPA: hypothetical protein DCQ29_02405 [Chitinophagaceae bacterium]|nr:hypothetical protein [Chitinophagaceae bacterium]
MKQRILYSLFFIFLITGVQAQQQNPLPRLYTAEEFVEQVRAYHPLARQAALRVDIAKADLLAARGNFDPTASLNSERKTFDGKKYFFYNNPEVKVPTWFGANIKAGIENNGGDRITRETTTGQSSYLGIEMPLARNLLMDKRRASVLKAEAYRSLSEQERIAALNDVLFDAYQAYWNWAGYYQLYNVYSRFVQVSSERFRLVKIAFANGDRAEMDTIEAQAQLQSFQVAQAEALIKLRNSMLEISNFLWMPTGDTAYLLPDNFRPDTINFTKVDIQVATLNDFLNRAITENPSLRSYDFKLNALNVERRLAFQSLLPYVDVKYNLLNKGYYVLKDANAQLFENNYKWGLSVKMPLFLREGRGAYKAAQFKIRETELQLSNKRWEIENKIRFYFTEFNTIQQQLLLLQNAYTNYTKLLRAEELRFFNGESSLFMINTRENKALETLEKLTATRIKYYKARYALEWSAGLLR